MECAFTFAFAFALHRIALHCMYLCSMPCHAMLCNACITINKGLGLMDGWVGSWGITRVSMMHCVWTKTLASLDPNTSNTFSIRMW